MLIIGERLESKIHAVDNRKETANWSTFRCNPFAALWYVHKGEFILHIDGETHSIAPGTMILIPPGCPFQASIKKEHDIVRILLIRFDIFAANQLNWFHLYRLPLIPKFDHKQFHAKFFLRMIFDFRRHSGLHMLRCTSMFNLLFCSLLERNFREITQAPEAYSSKYFKVAGIVQWMGNRLNRPLTRQDIAREIHLTPDHMNALFKSVMGVPPLQYLNQMRVDKAKMLLLETDMPVSDIGRAVGIEDALYFSRMFKKHAGISPSQFRKNLTGL